jgi:hypothetical protein
LSRILTSVSNGIERLRAITTAAPAAPAAAAECAICMGGESDSLEILGYIVGHGNGAPGHPDRFHQSCLQGCRNRCPMCRADGPLWGMHPPLGQGGGGLKRYRSRSKSKSKSKSRRYISKPRKSRKARKRIRHSSSRRK